MASPIVDHLAELTGFRDRDVLDVTLVGAFKDLLDPQSLAIYRCIGEAGDQRWMTRARQERDQAVPSADSAWAEPDTLPRAQEWPEHLRCFAKQEVVVSGAAPRALTLFPLSTDRELVGVLEIETEEPLKPESQRVVQSILRIYRNFQALLDYSERDALTGLLNRKTFDEAFMKSALGESSQFGQLQGDERRHAAAPNTWIGVIDIDHFKSVNDTYGHLIGDEVLLLLARLMRNSFRIHDRLYRFGGEEFVVLVRCGHADDARVAFERLRHNVESFEFPQVGRITVSVGYTSVQEGDSPTAAFERADKAVYHAKGNGRNQVHCHADLVQQGSLEAEAKVGDIEFF